VAFDIEFVTPETDIHFDIGSVTNTFFELRSRGSLFNPRNLVGAVVGSLVPRVVENMLDAKGEVDARLREAITTFVNSFVERMNATIPPPKPGKPAHFQPGEAQTRTEKVKMAVEREIPFLRNKLEEYVDDRRTREMLVQAVMEGVVGGYEEWFDAVYLPSLHANGAATGTGGRSGKGKRREDDVWDPNVFSEWCAGVFKVGRLGLGILGADEMDEEVERRDEGSEGEGEGRSVGGSVRTGTTQRTGGTGIKIRM